MNSQSLEAAAECLREGRHDELDKHLQQLSPRLGAYLVGKNNLDDYERLRDEAPVEGLMAVLQTLSGEGTRKFGRRLLRHHGRVDVYYRLVKNGHISPTRAYQRDIVRSLCEHGDETVVRFAQIGVEHARELARHNPLWQHGGREALRGVLEAIPEGAILGDGGEMADDTLVCGAIKNNASTILRQLTQRIEQDRQWWLEQFVEHNGLPESLDVLLDEFNYTDEELQNAFETATAEGQAVQALSSVDAVSDRRLNETLHQLLRNHPADYKTLALIQSEPPLDRSDVEAIYNSPTLQRGLQYLVKPTFMKSIVRGLIKGDDKPQVDELEQTVGVMDNAGSEHAETLEMILKHGEFTDQQVVDAVQTAVKQYREHELRNPRALLALTDHAPYDPGRKQGVPEVLMEAASEVEDKKIRSVFLDVLGATLQRGRANDLPVDRTDRLYELALWSGVECVEVLVEGGCVPSTSIVERIDGLQNNLGDVLRDQLNRRERQSLELQ